MVTTEHKPDKILTLDTFIEILEAIDCKISKNEPDKILKLKKIQGAFHEILAKALEYEMYKKEGYQYETLISIEVIQNQLPYQYTDKMLDKIV